MTPPEAPVAGNAADGETPPAVSVCAADPAPKPRVLTQRADFLRAARGRHARRPGLNLQARERKPGEAAGLRVGFTCSKKVGNAVARNRAKRRLREAARIVLPRLGRDGWDYVLIGKAGATAARPFAQLIEDLETAITALHEGRRT